MLNITMKKHISIIVTLFMISLMTGCVNANGYIPIPDAKVDLTPTNELIIELPGSFSLPQNSFSSGIYLKAVSDYKKAYPDVNVTVNYIGDKDSAPTDQYQTAESTAIMAGSGPDIILTDYFPDLYKVMDGGSFLNLNSIISGDKDFSMDDYKTEIMKAGYYKGGQYIMLVGYLLPTITGGKDILEKVGFDASNVKDVTSFINEVGSCLPKAEENPAFNRVIGDVSRLGSLLDNLLPLSGIRLVNMETRTVLPDESDLRTFCEAYKPLWSDDMAAHFFFDITPDTMKNGNFLFLFLSGSNLEITLIASTCYKSIGDTPIVIDTASLSGGLCALATNGVAINANSHNQLNAWNFIKIIMSVSSVEGAPTGNESYQYITAFPTNNIAFDKNMTTQADMMAENRDQFNKIGKSVAGYFDGKNPFWYDAALYPSVEDIDAIMPMLRERVTEAVLPCQAQLDIFKQCMEPYFTDKASLDDCISDLKSKLMLYASE